MRTLDVRQLEAATPPEHSGVCSFAVDVLHSDAGAFTHRHPPETVRPAARGAVLWRRLARPAAAQRARRAARGERARDDSGPVPVGRRHRRKLGPRTSLGWRQRTRGREECGQPQCQWVGVGSYRERSKSVVAVARGATAHQSAARDNAARPALRPRPREIVRGKHHRGRPRLLQHAGGLRELWRRPQVARARLNDAPDRFAFGGRGGARGGEQWALFVFDLVFTFLVLQVNLK